MQDVTLSHDEAQTYRIDVIAEELRTVAERVLGGMLDTEWSARLAAEIADQWAHDRDGYIEFATDGIR